MVIAHDMRPTHVPRSFTKVITCTCGWSGDPYTADRMASAWVAAIKHALKVTADA